MRATLHCLTIGGTLHRWDMLDLTAQDGNTAALPTQPEDESNRELLLTRTKASIIKLPFPSIALPTGNLPPTTHNHHNRPHLTHQPTTTTTHHHHTPPATPPPLARSLQPIRLGQPGPPGTAARGVRVFDGQPVVGGAAGGAG